MLFAVLVLLAGEDARAQRASAVAQSDRVPATINSLSRQVISGHVPDWVRTSTDLGPVDASRELAHLTLMLKRDDAVEAAFQQLLVDQHDPKSPRYQQWLTPAEVGELYGPTQHDVDAVAGWLAAQGLSVESVAPSRMAITFSGSAGTVQSAFATSIHTFKTPAGLTQSAVIAEPSVPSALFAVVSGVVGFANVQQTVFSHATPLSKAAANVSSFALRPDIEVNYAELISPGDFANIYGLAPYGTDATTGKGYNAAILIDSRVNLADVNGGASGTTIIVPSTTSDPGITGDAEEMEAVLDIDRVLGTASGGHVDLVVGKDLITTTTMNLLLYAIGTLNDPVINMSFGTCEQTAGKTLTAAFDSTFSTAAAQGIAIYVAAGDTGAAGCDTHGAMAPATQVLSTNFMCASQWVTCVGGTGFQTSQRDGVHWPGVPLESDNFHSVPNYPTVALEYIPETAWNEPGSTTFTVNGGGGGASQYIGKPSWQTGTGVPNDNARDTPDVSFASSSINGYYITISSMGGSFIFSGTSAAAPSMAGMNLIWNQKLGKRTGSVNSSLYGIAASSIGNYVFHDISLTNMGLTSCDLTTPTTCNNSTPGQYNLKGGLAGYAVGTGYDQATGLGSFDGYGVGQYLLNGTAASQVAITGNRSAVTAYFPASLSTAPTGYIQFFVNGQPWKTPVAISKVTVNSSQLYGATISLFSNDYFAFTYPLSVNVFGTASIDVVAFYYGDKTYMPGPSDKATYIAALNGFTPTLSVKSTPVSTLGTTLVATVAGNTYGFPNGTFEFHATIGGVDTVLGMAPGSSANSAYQVLLPNVSLPAGSVKAYVKYLGDPTYIPVSSATITIAVTASASTLTITPSATTFVAGAASPVTATLVSTAGAGPLPTGIVTVTDGSSVVGTGNAWTVANAPTNTTFNTTVQVTLTGTPGTRTLIATFAPDNTYLASTAKGVSVTLTSAPTVALTLAAASSTPYINTADVLTATLVSTPSSAAAPTGTITFYDGTTVLSTQNVGSGTSGTYTLTYSASFTTTGAHSLSAAYTPASGSTYAAVKSPAITVTAAAATLSASLAATKTTVDPNTSNVITVTVNTSPTTAPAPTGVVTILDGTTALGKATTLTAGGTAGTYTATFSSVLLTAGAHTLTASIASDSNYASVTSSPVTVTVNNVALAVPTLDKSSLSFTSGASTGNVVNVTYTSYNGLAATVPLACSITGSSATYPPTCTVSPSSVTLAAGGTATAAVTVNSTAQKSSMNKPLRPGSPLRDRLPLLAVTVPVLLFLRRRKVTMQWLMVVLLFTGAALSLSGCSGGGGGGSSTTSTPTTPTGSSAGTYTLTITATVNNSPVTTTVAVTIN